MDANTVNFTIVNFDANNKILGVTFDDHPAIVNIPLMSPLPQTQQDIEQLIKQYTAPVEIVQARTDANTDISFIADLVNQPITTTRFSVRPSADIIRLRSGASISANTNVNLNTPNLDVNLRAQITKNMELQQKSDLANTLISFGLLQTNPVDLSQIVQVVIPAANT